jgi:hypothetical protein
MGLDPRAAELVGAISRDDLQLRGGYIPDQAAAGINDLKA